MKAAPWIVSTMLLVALVFSTCASNRSHHEKDAQLDSIRSEEIRLRLDSANWSTNVATLIERDNLLGVLIERTQDSLGILIADKTELVRQVEMLGGQVIALSDMYLGAVSQIEAHGTVHSEAPGTVDSVTADVDDGLLAAHLFYRPPATLGADPYTVTIEMVGSVSELPDGRALFAARASDTRVNIRMGDVFYQPRPPVEYCGLQTRIGWGLGGLAIGSAVGFGAGISLGGLP